MDSEITFTVEDLEYLTVAVKDRWHRYVNEYENSKDIQEKLEILIQSAKDSR